MPISLVPAYIWPSDSAAWDRALAGPPGIVIVTGDNSGPGTERSDLLAGRIAWCVTKGWRAIGYVRLGYGNRPLGDVADDVDLWKAWYPQVTGVFFDEFEADDLTTASALTEIVRRYGTPNPIGAINAGTRVPAAMWAATWPTGSAWPCTMLVVVFEGTANTYATSTPQVHPRAVHLVYQAPARPVWPAGLGYAWSTPDGADGNPWNEVLP